MKDVKEPTKSGVVLGVNPEINELIVDDGNENILLIGPARSGKGNTTVIPTALTWKESAFFFDFRGLLWDLTSGYRKDGLNQTVVRFAPFLSDGTTAAWNPLAEIRIDSPYETFDVQDIASSLALPFIPEEHLGLSCPNAEMFKEYTAQFFTILIAHFINKNKEENKPVPNLGDIWDYINVPWDRLEKKLVEISAFPNNTPCLVKTLESFMKLEEATRVSVYKDAKEYLSIFNNPTLRKNTSVSDFSIRDLFNPAHKTSLYFCFNIKDIKNITPISRVLMTLLMNRSLQYMKDRGEQGAKYLFMLDDLPVLGQQEAILSFLDESTKYGIKSVITCRTINELQKLCPESDTDVKDKDFLVKNRIIGALTKCALQIFYAQNDSVNDTAEYVCRLNMHMPKPNEENLFGLEEYHISRPRELAILRDDREIICSFGKMPVIAGKIPYYKIDFIIDRIKMAPPVKSDILHEA